MTLEIITHLVDQHWLADLPPQHGKSWLPRYVTTSTLHTMCTSSEHRVHGSRDVFVQHQNEHRGIMTPTSPGAVWHLV